MKLRAKVIRSTGNTRHTIGTIVNGKLVPTEVLPVPAWVEISAEYGAFYLYYFDSTGTCMTDTWHQSEDDAKAQAEFEFGILANEWMPVPEEMEDSQ